jgi:hypothetical protein
MERLPLKPETVELTPAQAAFLRETVAWFDLRSCRVTCAGRAGSDRRFVRVVSPDRKSSRVLVVWNSADNDWQRFIAIQRDLAETVPFLPRIYAYDDRHGLILEEDLGDLTLKKCCAGRTLASITAAYHTVLDALASWQRVDPNASATISSRDMDAEMFLWESEYFAVHCVKEYFGLDNMLTPAWERERVSLAAQAAAFPRVCIHRDFQSENILLRGASIRFVDYQGARLGPAAYDVASLLYDPYITRLTFAFGKRLFGYYQSVAPLKVSAHSFRICSLQRLMQALGAYGNLSIHKGKDWYREYVPVALWRLKAVVDGKPSFPALSAIVDACVDACEKPRKGRKRAY